MRFRDLEAYRGFVPADADQGHVVIGVSGGRSSAYQMAHIVEAHGGRPEGAIFAFENTGREVAETLDFVHRLDRHFQLGLVWLEYDPASPTKVRVVSYETASRNGEPFDAMLSEVLPRRRDGTPGVRPLPNPVQRTCTATLKTKTAHRYVRRHLGWSTRYYAALGYRADERARYERRVKLDAAKGFDEGGKMTAPMYHAGVVDADVRSFWAATTLDLAVDSTLTNCDLCFMKAEWKVKEIMMLEAIKHQIRLRPGALPPPSVQWWIDKEERQGDRPGTFRKDRPSYRAIWEAVCHGDLLSTLSEEDDRCGSCTD